MKFDNIRAGDLRQLVTIEQPKDDADSFGQRSQWETFAENVPAMVQDVRGSELYRSQQFVDQVTHIVTIRYLTGLEMKMRVIFEGRELQIQAVLNPDQRRIRHDILCLERAIS